MEKLKDLIINILTHQNRLGKDKLAHFYSSALGFALFTIVLSDVYASILVALVALSKEIIHDWEYGRGNPEVLDAVMSVLPILLYWLMKI